MKPEQGRDLWHEGAACPSRRRFRSASTRTLRPQVRVPPGPGAGAHERSVAPPQYQDLSCRVSVQGRTSGFRGSPRPRRPWTSSATTSPMSTRLATASEQPHPGRPIRPSQRNHQLRFGRRSRGHPGHPGHPAQPGRGRPEHYPAVRGPETIYKGSRRLVGLPGQRHHGPPDRAQRLLHQHPGRWRPSPRTPPCAPTSSVRPRPS